MQLAPSSAKVLVPTVLVMVGGPWTTTVTRNLALARARKEIWVGSCSNLHISELSCHLYNFYFVSKKLKYLFEYL